MTKRLGYRLGFLAVLLLLGMSLAGCKDKEKQIELGPLFEQNQLDTSVQYRFNRPVPELPRLVKKVDGVVDSATVPYESGQIGHLKFFTEGKAKGKVKSAEIFYPVQEGEKEARKAREFEMDVDGAYVSDTGWYVNGNLQFAAKRNGTELERLSYRLDGQTIARDEQFKLDETPHKWLLMSQKDFFPSAGLQRELTRLSGGSADIKTYNEQHVLLTRAVLSEWADHVIENIYGDDGAVVKQIDEISQRVAVKTLENGIVKDERAYGYGFDNVVVTSMFVSVYDEHNVLQYRQTWVADFNAYKKALESPYKTIDPSEFKLAKLVFFAPNGKQSKEIQLWSDGKTPRNINTSNTESDNYYPSSRESYRKDGTLESKSGSDEKNKYFSEEHKAEDNIRFAPIGDEFFKARPFIAPTRILSELQKKS